MRQGKFFDHDEDGFAHKLSRRDDPDTSKEAARILPLNDRCRFALGVLRDWPGSTAAELDAVTDALPGSVRKRLNDLRERGMAKKGEKRKCRITGRRAYTWVPV